MAETYYSWFPLHPWNQKHWIAKRTGLSQIGDLIQQRRRNKFGHLIRMDRQAPVLVSLGNDWNMHDAQEANTTDWSTANARSRVNLSWNVHLYCNALTIGRNQTFTGMSGKYGKYLVEISFSTKTWHLQFYITRPVRYAKFYWNLVTNARQAAVGVRRKYFINQTSSQNLVSNKIGIFISTRSTVTVICMQMQ